MALEEFTDTDDGEKMPPASPARVLATFTVPDVLTNKRISFAFPKQKHEGAWNARRLEEHNLNLHQQRVTSVFLEMRSRRTLDMDPSVLA
jgi:hypothetical protein